MMTINMMTISQKVSLYYIADTVTMDGWSTAFRIPINGIIFNYYF
jgi:hypothetical protein